MTTNANICPWCGSRLVPANLWNAFPEQPIWWWCVGKEGQPCAYSEWRMALTSTAKQEQVVQGELFAP